MTIRAPHLSPKRERRVQSPSAVPNLLVTTLAVVIAAPFNQSDWPNSQPLEIQQPVQLGMPLAIFEDAGEKPFAQIDWPNPTVAVLIQAPFQVGSSLTLIETAGEKPFAQYDWPNPILPPLPITRQVGSSIDLLTSVVVKPFSQLDWPNPIISPVPISWQAGSSIDLLTPVSVRITAIQLSMAAPSILLLEKTPNIRLEQIASKIVFRE